MGNITISGQEVLSVLVGTVAIVSAIWHAAMYIGKLTVRVSRIEDRIEDHDVKFDRWIPR